MLSQWRHEESGALSNQMHTASNFFSPKNPKKEKKRKNEKEKEKENTFLIIFDILWFPYEQHGLLYIKATSKVQ